MISNVKSRLMEILEKQHGTVTVQDLALQNISRPTIAKLAQEGLIIKVDRGLYVGRNAHLDKYLAIRKRYPRIVFSHLTAAYLLGKLKREPDIICVTLRSSDSSLPKTLQGRVLSFYKKEELFDCEVCLVETPLGNLVPCYSWRKTKEDILHCVSRLDLDKDKLSEMNIKI